MALILTATVCGNGPESSLLWCDASLAFVLASVGLPLPAYWCWSLKGYLQTHGYNDYGGAGPIFAVRLRHFQFTLCITPRVISILKRFKSVIFKVSLGGCLCMSMFSKEPKSPQVDGTNILNRTTRDK